MRPNDCHCTVCDGGRLHRQAVPSPILFSVYIDGLLIRLSTVVARCHIGHQFVGILAYADYLVLLALTSSAIRKLLAICDD